jgi:urease accessory protein
MPVDNASGVRLLQLISANLPVGAFSYSQGMEWAVECGWLTDTNETRSWLQSVLRDSLQYFELPVLRRLYQAAARKNRTDFEYWSQWLYVNRETLELREEERQRARAMLSLLKKLPDSKDWPELEDWQDALLSSQLAGFALAAQHWRIPLSDLLQGYTWSWLDNAVAVAVKLVPLGQSDGQRLLYELGMDIAMLVHSSASIDDDMIGASTPALAIASSLHETQYSRLFRS